MNGQTALRARFLQTEREFHQSRSVTNHGQGSKQVTALSIPTAWQPVAVVRASLPPPEPTANVGSLPTEPQQQGDALKKLARCNESNLFSAASPSFTTAGAIASVLLQGRAA